MSLALLKKISKFKKKFFHGLVTNTEAKPIEGVKVKDHIMWSYQHLPDTPGADGKKSIQYWPARPLRPLKDDDLVFHFEQVPRKIATSFKGSLAVVGGFEGGIAKWFCVDCDNQEAVDVIREKFIPVLESYSIDYIWEFSGTNDEEKAHVWFMCDPIPIILLRDYVDQIFEDAGISSRDKVRLGLELYPTVKDSNVIRLPGGIHLKTKTVNPVLWREKIGSSAEFVLDCFIGATPETEEKIKSVLRPKIVKKKPTNYKFNKFHYNSRNLPLPDSKFPPLIRKVGSNCQAVNKVIWDTYKDDLNKSLINDRTGAGHIAGKWLWNLAIINDVNLKDKEQTGEKWIQNFTEENRSRDWEQHGWHKDKKDIKLSPDRFFPTCDSWEKNFGACEGCPFRHRIHTPKQIWTGSPIRKQLVKEVKLCSAEDVRQSTFKEVRASILGHLERGESKDILLASFQGSGKSWAVAEIAAELSALGKTVIMAVPTADIAMQFKNWIEEKGQKVFVVMSHEKLFEKFDLDFDCPHDNTIQYLYDLGFSSGMWKKKLCGNCHFLDKCPYPNQYADIEHTDAKIIIIQHAHFTCRETLFRILKRKYDVLFVDEAFIDSCHKDIKPRQAEIEVLDTFKESIPWVQLILNWFTEGGYPKLEADKTIIRPTEIQLELIKFKMEELRLKWNVPDYIRYFNLNMYLEKHKGFHIFHPLPSIPIRVFTDATPPLEYLKIVLDNEDIEIYGEDEVLDFRKLNKNNRLIQCLDASMSKSSLKGIPDENGEFLYERFSRILDFIIQQAKNEHKDKKILITTYCDGEGDQFKSIALDYIKRNAPELNVGFEPPAQICISHMMIGTNKFSDYLVQYLVAGVYRNGKQLKHEVYKLRSIQNFWNRLKGRPEVPNLFPYGVGDESTIPREEEPLKRILPINNKAAIFAYEGFNYRRPADPDYNIIERFAIAKTQQAIRLRFIDDRERIVYVFGNYFLPSFLVTDSILEADLIY